MDSLPWLLLINLFIYYSNFFCIKKTPLQSWHCNLPVLHSFYFFLFFFFLFSETGVDEDEELYDCVYGEDEGGEVYEDLMKDEAAQQPVCFLIPYFFCTTVTIEHLWNYLFITSFTEIHSCLIACGSVVCSALSPTLWSLLGKCLSLVMFWKKRSLFNSNIRLLVANSKIYQLL